MVRQLARYSQWHATIRFHRARLGGTTTGPLQAVARHDPFPPSSSRWDDNWPATGSGTPRSVSTELVSVGRQLARYRQWHATIRFHRARLGGTTTGPLQAVARHDPFPPSSSRWDDNVARPATGSGTPRSVSTELVSVGRQLARYRQWHATIRFHRARLGGTTTGPLQAVARHDPFPPSSSRWDDNWPATGSGTPRSVSTELVSVGRQLARYRQWHATIRFHRARLGGTTTGPLQAVARHDPFPPSSSRWDDNWPATGSGSPRSVSTELVSVGRQLARYSRPHVTRTVAGQLWFHWHKPSGNQVRTLRAVAGQLWFHWGEPSGNRVMRRLETEQPAGDHQE